MATAMDDKNVQESNHKEMNEIVSTKSSVSKKNDIDDVPDYNEAFPELISSGKPDIIRSNTFFPSQFPSSSKVNNTSDAMAHTTASIISSTKNDEERRRKMAIHASSSTTKIIEIPPEERALDYFRRPGSNQSSRNPGANNAGQPLQKICARIQKETSTDITFLYKDQTLLVSITGRPEQVRLAQVQILREIQRPTKSFVKIPLEYHGFIIGPRGSTLKNLEQETLTRIIVPPQEKNSDEICIMGAKDNVKLCEQKILESYHALANKGFERLLIPRLYHPWIRSVLVDDLKCQLNVSVDVPPQVKQTDEITVRGEREPVEQAKAKIMRFYENLKGKIMTFPLDIPCEQHRFILGKKAAGVKDIFDKTNVVVRIPTLEENSSIIQVMGETEKIGEAITMIYKMANAFTVVHIDAPHWMHDVLKSDRNTDMDHLRKTYPHVRILFRDDHITLEGPPEDVEHIRNPLQTAVDEFKKKYTAHLQIEIDPQYYKQLIGKNQTRLLEMQEQSGCEFKFPHDGEGRLVKLMGTKESVEKGKQLLAERVKKLTIEYTADVSIDPQYYAQIIGTKGKNLEEVRSKFNNIQITFPEANGKSDKVTLQGNKDDVEKCAKFLQQKIKDLYSIEINIPKRLHPILIGKSGSNIQRLREKLPDVRIDMISTDDNKESSCIRLSGKKPEVDKARKFLDEHINQLNTSIENSIEQYITIDPKWHSKFFQNRRKLLIDLQQQYGDMLIKLPERTTNSDQVLLRGPKETIEYVRKRLEELIDTWENTTTKEMIIPHRHHRYLLVQRGANVQSIQKDYNIQIKFPPREVNQKTEHETTNDDVDNQKDIVRLTGRNDDINKAMIVLEQMIPIESSIDIPYEAHGSIVGKSGSNLQLLSKKYPLVVITMPPVDSKKNTIILKGSGEQMESVKNDLLEIFEKVQADRQARSYEIRFAIKPEYRPLILGTRGKTINNLRQKYDTKIDIGKNQTSSAIVPTSSTINNDENPTEQQDDQQATPNDNLLLPNETVNSNPLSDMEIVITGYEDKALACRDEILQLIKDFEAKITMEIELDPRIHARIIGSGGQKLQQIMKEYDVEIKFQANNQDDKVHVIGLDQDKIDGCIDHLFVLEEDFLQDLPYRSTININNSNESIKNQQSSNNQYQQQEVPTTNNNKKLKNENTNRKQQRQAPFQVKNAPWTNGNEYENNFEQHNYSRQRNERENSPKKSTPLAPNRDDLGEYPLFVNGLSVATNDRSSQVQKTTVNTVPVIWGPQKRNK